MFFVARLLCCRHYCNCNSLLCFLSNNHWKLHVVLNPQRRHHSKKATIQRQVDHDRAIIDTVAHKARILQLCASVRPQDRSAALNKEIVDLEKKCQVPGKEALVATLASLSKSVSRMQAWRHRVENNNIQVSVGPLPGRQPNFSSLLIRHRQSTLSSGTMPISRLFAVTIVSRCTV